MLASDGVFAMKIVAFFFSGELLIRAAPLIVSVVPAWAATSSVLTPTPFCSPLSADLLTHNIFGF
jgi:hypothetical protein